MFAAIKPYNAAIASGATPEQLRAGAQRYAEQREREEPDLVKRDTFTACPATWLNQKRGLRRASVFHGE